MYTAVTGSIEIPTYLSPDDRKKNFEQSFYRILDRDNVTESDVCIIMYKTLWFGSTFLKEIFMVYKTIEDFKLKFDDDLKKLDQSSGIDLQVWMYD